MKLNVISAILFPILILSGCTSDPMMYQTVQQLEPTWQKSGVSQNDVNSALQKCRYDIGMANVSSEKENTLLKACLESKGYRYTTSRLN